MARALWTRLRQRLPELRRLRRVHATILPDVFIDHVVTLPVWDVTEGRLRAIHTQGGGSWPDLPQELRAGGNAANTAIALARLGAKVSLVATADPIGRLLLRAAAPADRLDLENVRVSKRSALTTALEAGGSNVMLSHAGPVAQFGPGQVTEAAWRAIESSDIVGVTNWALNRRGTALARSVFARARRAGATTFFDSADPSSRRGETAKLLEALGTRDLAAWGLNENELRWFSGARHPITERAGILAAVGRLQERVRARLDVHTVAFSVSREGTERVEVPGLRVRALRATGAGDAWNAGNLAGEALGWPAEERLALANAVAAHHVSAHEPGGPTPKELAQFLPR